MSNPNENNDQITASIGGGALNDEEMASIMAALEDEYDTPFDIARQINAEYGFKNLIAHRYYPTNDSNNDESNDPLLSSNHTLEDTNDIKDDTNDTHDTQLIVSTRSRGHTDPNTSINSDNNLDGSNINNNDINDIHDVDAMDDIDELQQIRNSISALDRLTSALRDGTYFDGDFSHDPVIDGDESLHMNLERDTINRANNDHNIHNNIFNQYTGDDMTVLARNRLRNGAIIMDPYHDAYDYNDDDNDNDNIDDTIIDDLEDVCVPLPEHISKYSDLHILSAAQAIQIDEGLVSKDDVVVCRVCCPSSHDEKLADVKADEWYHLLCGHDVCTDCADNWFKRSKKCPFCRSDLHDLLHKKMREVINSYKS